MTTTSWPDSEAPGTGDGPPAAARDGEHGPDAEDVPHDLFGGRFDGPPPAAGTRYYRDGAARPVVDAAALLEGSTRSSARPSCTPARPLLIVAGAGSGKTRVLTHRIAYLLGRARRPPRRDPGDHLHQQGRRRDEGARRGSWSARAPSAMWVSTFHSACVRILRREAEQARLQVAASRSTTPPTPSG